MRLWSNEWLSLVEHLEAMLEPTRHAKQVEWPHYLRWRTLEHSIRLFVVKFDENIPAVNNSFSFFGKSSKQFSSNLTLAGHVSSCHWYHSNT